MIVGAWQRKQPMPRIFTSVPNNCWPRRALAEHRGTAAHRRGVPIPLAPKVFDTLVALIERKGCLVRREELVERLWPDCTVEEGTLARDISDLRKAGGGGVSKHERPSRA